MTAGIAALERARRSGTPALPVARRAGLAALAGALLICGCLAGAAEAAQSAKLQVSLSSRTGSGAAPRSRSAFQIEAPEGALPAALTALDVRLPPGMGVDTRASRRAAQPSSNTARGAAQRGARVGTGKREGSGAAGERNQARDRGAHRLQRAAQGWAHHARCSTRSGKPADRHAVRVHGRDRPRPSRADSIEAAIPLIPALPNTPDAAIVEMTATLGTRSHDLLPDGRGTGACASRRRARRCPVAARPGGSRSPPRSGSTTAAPRRRRPASPVRGSPAPP